ncbi:MAG: hypothetical protein JKX81_17050 [Arenicella sp.]|nr:hypothetical protein [Arenicella sp.]
MIVNTNRVDLVLQSESGAIISYVEREGKSVLDQNNFITALWLRELRMQSLEQFAFFDKPKALALDYLDNSASTRSDYARAYGFWPERFEPEWAVGITTDIDDTAIVNHELLLAGKTSSKQLKREFYQILNSVRVPKNTVNSPCWVSPGCYYTWFPRRSHNNIVDVCANTNAVALLATLNAKTAPGYQAACETINNSIKWASNNLSRLSAITPYYPSPFELLFALEHAIQCGAHELLSARDTLAQILSDSGLEPVSVICSAAYGNNVWRCDAISALRHQRFNCFSTADKRNNGSALCKY